MAEEQAIKDQIAGMEGWAIKTKQKVDAGKYEEAEKLLRTINTQGRRLEWRGGSSGLKHLPEMEEVKVLKKKVSEARAAAQTATGAITDLGNSSKEIKQLEAKLKDAEAKLSSAGTTKAKWISANIVSIKGRLAKINKEIDAQKKTAGKTISILTEVLKEANALAQEEPWLNLTKLAKAKLIRAFLSGESYFNDIPWEERRRIWNDRMDVRMDNLVISEPLPLKKVDLRGFNFKNVIYKGYTPIFEECNLSYAQFDRVRLEEVQFLNCNLYKASFTHSYLLWVKFPGSNLTGVDFDYAALMHCYFKDSIIDGTRLIKANIDKSDLDQAKVLKYL